MKKIEILGPGCPKCKQLTEQTQRTVDELRLNCTIEKVTELDKILGYGVIMTPALVVDGRVLTVGKVPSLDELKRLLTDG